MRASLYIVFMLWRKMLEQRKELILSRGFLYKVIRSPGEGNGNPLQYSCLENPMDGGAWRATVHGVAKSRTRLSDVTSSILKEGSGRSSGERNGNPTHSSILAWRIPWTEEPGGLQSMGSQRVGHDWATSLFTFTFTYALSLFSPLHGIIKINSQVSSI